MYPSPRTSARRAGIQTFALWAAMLPLLGAGETSAGSVDASAPPDNATSAMYTLQDLHQRLLDGSPGTKRGAAFTEPASGPGPTMVTLDQFMAFMPQLDKSDGAAVGNVRQGKKFWGLTSGGWGSRSSSLVKQTPSAVSISHKRSLWAHRKIQCKCRISSDLVGIYVLNSGAEGGKYRSVRRQFSHGKS